MVKLTTKYLFGRISKKNKLQPRNKDETDLEYLQRITHLHLQSQFIDRISVIPECESVKVVYLQNNLLRSIHNIDCFPKITHLYLQHNFISKIENLDKLTSLRKLYLGNNEISVVEGLEKLNNLTELHIENQRLSRGETIYFDPLTLDRLRNSLKVLNVSNNNITSMFCLSDLTCLTTLNIEKNEISDLTDVMETLSRLPMLETVNMDGNPVASNRKFLDSVVVSSKSVRNLNGKQIDEQTRLFMTNLAYNKECRKRMSHYSTRVITSSENLQGIQRPVQSFNELDPHLGSKLFPILKPVMDNRQKNLKVPVVDSNKGVSVLKNSLNISRLSGSASYHL